MAITKPQLKSLIQSQLPEYVKEEYDTFVQFLQAYYEYLETTQVDLYTARDLDKTLESFITYFKHELAAKLPYSTIDERFLLAHIKDHYRAKGSENSFKLLFRILFNKEVTLDYPSKQMLRASDGKWNQDVSVFVKIIQGHPNDIIGKLVDIVTSTKIIRVLVDRRQYVEVEVDRAVRLSDTVYEFFIDRRFFGNISVGDRLRYRDDANGIFFNGQVLTTTQNVVVQQAGTGFKVGDLYNIKNFDGYGSILKVSSVTPTGGIASGVFIKYGIGYTTDFTTTISASTGQDVAGTAGTVISRVDTYVGINVVTNLTITEGMDGFAETGTFSVADYNIPATTDPSYAAGPALDGTYAGQVVREFGISSVDSKVSLTEPAILKVTLGPLAKYPGYYVNNDGFLDDAIYIQDSRYYQAYSYVIKIDEALDTYKTAVKNLVHPAGMAIFGEYDIRNEFDIGITLESMLKILNVTVNDSTTAKDEQGELFTRTVPYLDYSKPIDETTLNYDNYSDGHSVTITEVGYANDSTRTLPYLEIAKPLNSTTLNYNGSAESQDVTPSEQTATYADSSTRLGAEIFNFSKGLSAGHFINDGTTTDDESVTMTEIGYASDLSRTLPILDVSKLLYSTTFNYDNVLDNNTATITEATYPMAGTDTRTGLSIVNSDKLLSNGHYWLDGTTVDTETATIVDTDATSATDLNNRTTPAIALTTTLNSQYYIVGTGTYAGDDNITVPASDESGVLDLNPYAAGDYFLHDNGLYVGVPYVAGQGFGYQTFTGAGA
jgi:hypothetical protein